MREYSSFEEIDKDLKILKLQTEIDKEEIKLKLDQTKSQLSPGALIGSTFGSFLQKIFAMKAVSKLMNMKSMRSQDGY